ncbi:MAG: M20/M25/M40 family metallo-hydrolase [Caldilineaceae bacterium]
MADTPAITGKELFERAKAMQDKISGWRREIHRYPELTFTEHRTAGLVNAALIDLGIKTETEVAKTGVVGHIQGGSGPVVGLRADMDALPITEESGVDFGSTRPGIMHACGHDAHTAMLLGAATLLKGLADEGRLPGTIACSSSPAKRPRTTKAVRRDAHGGRKGAGQLRRRLRHSRRSHAPGGRGRHQIRPHDGRRRPLRDCDPRQGWSCRPPAEHGRPDPVGQPCGAGDPPCQPSPDPIESGVITVGLIQGGTVNNVIPETVRMEGTIRSFTPESRKLLQDELRRACGVVEALGGTFDLVIHQGYPPTVLDEKATAVMMAATREFLGDDNVKLGTAARRRRLQLHGAKPLRLLPALWCGQPKLGSGLLRPPPQFRMDEGAATWA